MGRPKARPDPDPFGELVMDAWRLTTLPQRELCFENWAEGDGRYYLEVAKLLYLNADALLLACLLEFGHESVCHPTGRPRGCHYGKLCAMMQEWQPVDNSLETVDNSAFSVEKTVEKPVHNFGTYPHIHSEPMY